MREEPIKSGWAMNVRQLFFTSVTLGFLVLSGCGSSSANNSDGAKTPDDVSSSSSSGDSSSANSDKPADTRPANDTKEMPHGAKATTDNSIPDDYTLTERDCVELAKQYVRVQRADQLLNLSPKLSEAQRAQGEKAIDDAVGKLGEGWENGCRSSLVGGVVDRQRLKCAMASKSVKGFDECINGENPPN